jgi:hypothetical protein
MLYYFSHAANPFTFSLLSIESLMLLPGLASDCDHPTSLPEQLGLRIYDHAGWFV